LRSVTSWQVPDHPHRLAVGVALEVGPGVHVPDGPVGPDDAKVVLERAGALDLAGRLGAHPFAIVGVDELEEARVRERDRAGLETEHAVRLVRPAHRSGGYAVRGASATISS
jgi:hypothetical protein